MGFDLGAAFKNFDQNVQQIGKNVKAQNTQINKGLKLVDNQINTQFKTIGTAAKQTVGNPTYYKTVATGVGNDIGQYYKGLGDAVKGAGKGVGDLTKDALSGIFGGLETPIIIGAVIVGGYLILK